MPASIRDFFPRRNVITTGDGQSDHENITVAPAATTSTKRKASASHNSERVYTTHEVTRHGLKELTANEFNSVKNGRIAFVDLRLSKRQKLPKPRKQDFSTISQSSDELRDESSSNQRNDSHSPDFESGPSDGRRLRRSAAGRKSYVPDYPSSSEDELVAPTLNRRRAPPQSKPNTSRKTKQHDSDDEYAAPAGDLDVVSESDLASELEASDENDGTASESDVSAISSKTSRPASKAKASSRPGSSKSAGTRSRMKNLLRGAKEVDMSLAPRSAIDEIFHDLTDRAMELGLKKAVAAIRRPIRVATMCSGTESPLLAFEMIQDALRSISDLKLEVDHLFSAEIVAFKQAYIERNFSPPVIFRDIRDLTRAVDDEIPEATTAYGGKVAIPRELDMVIAGTSCVDFSGLNTHKKGLGDGGESDDTWTAVLSYCRAFRPAIVLLENVSGASWNEMLSDYEKLGYECAGALVDTRNYYIPHVRQRGYMACFNKGAPGFTVGAAQQWSDLMAKFQRPASSPVSAFLQPNDQIIRQQIRNDEPVREVDWSQCQLTQSEYRQETGIGYARPITRWSESGSMQPPDHGHLPWFQPQVERVLDTIDGAILRKSLPAPRPETETKMKKGTKKETVPPGMYDARFKTRIFDLSQNIHRETDHRPFGIAGCITPSGMFFVTDLCRVLTAEETLKLQGIPLSKISFTTETPAEIQDLAGNAMSSTVIGSSILASIVAGYGALGHGTMKGCGVNPAPIERRVIVGDCRPVQQQTNALDMDISEMLRLAEASMRRCFCETECGIAEKPIQQCIDCGHTTCTVCGGNPFHNYQQHHAMERVLPAAFEGHVRSSMPLRLRLSLAFSQTGDAAFDEAVVRALEDTFSFQRVRRTHRWAIIYNSSTATLELSITDGSRAEWRLYALPDKESPGNSKLRGLLQQPVVKSTVSNSICPTEWLLRTPKLTRSKATITGSGKQIASWWSRNEIPDFVNHRVWQFLTIETADKTGSLKSLTGKYQYLPRCGKACDSLYKKIGSDVFLFLDPTPTGHPDEDCFVFSKSIAMLERDEVRPVLGRIAAPWRPWTPAGDTPLNMMNEVNLVIDQTWASSKGSLDIVESRVAISVATTVLAGSPVCTDLEVLVASTAPAHDVASLPTNGRKFFSPKDGDFFQAYAWLFEEMRRHLKTFGSGWTKIDNSSLYDRCLSCEPQRPELRWAWDESKKDLRPYEDPKAAATFERQIKERPEPVSVLVKQASGASTFSLGVNVNTLAHRAGARLPPNYAAAASHAWRFVTTAPEIFKFKPFKISDTRGVAPYSGELDGMTIKLFPKQLMSLAWMRQQEEGARFVLDETEEANIPALGWRAEARARVDLVVRGGICADHPGFGKTIISLALVHAEALEHKPKTICENLAQSAGGLIPTSATLIVCQASLVQQWIDEIHEKLPSYKGYTIAVKQVGDFSKLAIKGFEKARIVVVSTAVLTNSSYLDRLAAFGAVPAPFSLKSGRQLAHWLRRATEQIPEHLKVLQSESLKALQKRIEAKYKANLQDPQFNAFVPSRRLKGQAYVDAKSKQPELPKSAVASEKIALSGIDQPLLEMFYWNRIIVDEFHQNDSKIMAVINSLKADKHWGLSATPALSDFYEVSKIGALLGVPLQLGSISRGLMKKSSFNELRKDMTKFEIFDTMRQMPTHSMHHRIYEQDQRFLDTFLRRNLMAMDELPIQEHLVPVTLDLDHRALYAELSQHLNSLSMRIRKGKGASDREMRFRAAVSSSSSAEEALSKVAAFSDRSLSTKSRDLGLQGIINDRAAKYNAILSELPSAVARSKGTEKANFEKWLARLESGALGDQDLTAIVLPIAESGKSVIVNKRGAGMKGKAQGARALTAELNSACERLLVEKRSGRYIENLLEVIQSKKPHLLCDRDGCNKKSEAIAVSALCGHKVCRGCYEEMKDHEIVKCPSHGCSAPMMHFHLLWPDRTLPTITRYGGKIEAALDILETIQRKQEPEQAVLFVQFENQLAEIEAALEERNISSVVVNSVLKASDQIKDFRESTGKHHKTVIVLNASNETAAGINLQCANHVIFLSPLLRETQYGYDSTMAQAIGRVRRHGQTRKIHVYRIFALHTVDVDILELRERRVDALSEQGHGKIEPRGAKVKMNEHGEPKAERTQLVKEGGNFSLRPQSWLVAKKGGKNDGVDRMRVKNRLAGWEDFSSLVKFSKAFTEDEED